MSFGERLKNAWNAFTNKNPPDYAALGGGYYYRPDRTRFSHGNERSIVTASQDFSGGVSAKAHKKWNKQYKHNFVKIYNAAAKRANRRTNRKISALSA